jgi:hypothetical protein
MKRFFAWTGGDLDLDKVSEERMFLTYGGALDDARKRQMAPFRIYELQPYPRGYYLFNGPTGAETIQNEGK